MFEKEAEEYVHTKHCEKCSTGHCDKKCVLVKDDYDTFKDGAEFGYNKCKEEFEKENVELKLKLEALEGQTPWKDIKDKSEVIEQLTKAKDILRMIVYWKSDNKELLNFINKAEQFLKE